MTKELEEPKIEELKLEIETPEEEEDLILPEEETVDEQIDNLNLYLRFNANQIPTVAAGVGAGTTPGTPTLTNANDTKGQVNITTGTATPTGTIATVTFARNYDKAPIVVLTPANAATAALDSGGFSITKGTISNNNNVTTSTGAGTNTDSDPIAHGLGTTPTKITISAKIYAKGDTTLTGGCHMTLQGTAVFNSSGNIISIAGVGWYALADGTIKNDTTRTPPILLLSGTQGFVAQGYPTGGSAHYEQITISLVSIDVTYFTFRINGVLVGAAIGNSTVTNISWIAEGSTTSSKIIATPTTTAFTIDSTTTALTDSTAYSWFYHCLE